MLHKCMELFIMINHRLVGFWSNHCYMICSTYNDHVIISILIICTSELEIMLIGYGCSYVHLNDDHDHVIIYDHDDVLYIYVHDAHDVHDSLDHQYLLILVN